MDLRGIDSVANKGATEALRGIDTDSRVSTGVGVGTDIAPATSFSDVLSGVVQEASQRSQVADAKADAFARGTLDDVHGTMIAAKEADISLKLVGSIRNKLLDAFQELWRTNV